MIIPRPRRPARQSSTMLARVTPRPSGFDIRTFERPACDHVHQGAIEFDPMKSRETLGWLRSELRPPA